MRTRHLAVLLALATSPLAQQVAPRATVFTETLSVVVNVVDGVATTTLEQRIRNTGPRQAEATWILPLPPGAAADGFEMLVNGERQSGDVLAADQARSVYEGIVRRQRDPGLLEYLGRGCLRARIFPIPANGETTASVSFRHVLPREAGLVSWSFAARAAGVNGVPPRNLRLDLSAESRRAIKNAFSPSPLVHVLQPSDHRLRASFEGGPKDLPEGDLALFYGLSQADFGLDLITDPGDANDPDPQSGTFLMLLSPKRHWEAEGVTRKSITFVLDTSGSMRGEKLRQAVASLRAFLDSLHAEDHFNVVPFSTEAEPLFEAPVPATEANRRTALERAQALEAIGGTNLADALEAGLARRGDGERVPILVLLTDGQPTVGVQEPESILELVLGKASALDDDLPAPVRVFVLGVGGDVNTQLLDRLSDGTRGRSDYVLRDGEIERRTSSLFRKLSHPVLTDLAIEVDGVQLLRTVPKSLPDLFAGETLELFGRYRGSGTHAIRLSGSVRGERHGFTYEGEFVARADEGPRPFAFLPRLWAERRVGLLLDALRLGGASPGATKELEDEVRRLGTAYRIVTPYTSHLIVEEGMAIARNDTLAPAQLEALRALGYSGGADDSSASPGSGAFFLGGRSQAARTPGKDRHTALEQAIRSAELLAEDADDAEVDALARELGQALAENRQKLATLAGDEVSGESAVERSLYLRRLRERGVTDREALLGLFSKRVRGRVFLLRRGFWTDSELVARPRAITLEVSAFSPEYFALLAQRPELAPFLAMGERVLLRFGDEVLRVRPAEDRR